MGIAIFQFKPTALCLDPLSYVPSDNDIFMTSNQWQTPIF